MTVQTNNFISDVVLFLRNTLRESITDPLNRNDGFIFTAYPKRDVVYPIITIKNTNVSTEKLGMQSESQDTTLTIEIQVWARNSKEADTLSQDVINTLRTSQFGTDSTNVEEIFGFKLNSCTGLVDEGNDLTIHRKVHSYTYRVILC